MLKNAQFKFENKMKQYSFVFFSNFKGFKISTNKFHVCTKCRFERVYIYIYIYSVLKRDEIRLDGDFNTKASISDSFFEYTLRLFTGVLTCDLSG